MGQESVNILINAIDNASATLKKIEQSTATMANGMESAAAKSEKLSQSNQRMSLSAKDLVYSFAAIGTSLMSLWNAYDRIVDSQMYIDRANLRVTKTQESLNDAYQKYNELIKQTTPNVDKLAHAELARQKANQSLSKAQDSVLEAQRAYNIALFETGSMSYATQKAAKELKYAQEDVGFAKTEAGFAETDYNKVVNAIGASSDAAIELLDKITILEEQLRIQQEFLAETKERANEAWVQAAIQIPLAIVTLVGAIGTLVASVNANTMAQGGKGLGNLGLGSAGGLGGIGGATGIGATMAMAGPGLLAAGLTLPIAAGFGVSAQQTMQNIQKSSLAEKYFADKNVNPSTPVPFGLTDVDIANYAKYSKGTSGRSVTGLLPSGLSKGAYENLKQSIVISNNISIGNISSSVDLKMLADTVSETMANKLRRIN